MSASKNSFIQMQEEDNLNFPLPPEIEENVIGSLQVLAMMGQAMELFIPKALEMFILTLGGTVKEIDSTASQELPTGDPSNDTDEITPGTAGDNTDSDL